MTNTLIAIGLKLLAKITTERFFARVLMIGVKAISKSTANKVDDEICSSLGEALGNPCD